MTNLPNKDKPASLLKETRQHKGITLEMVHEATKISLDALKAIEQGYSVHKLQTFYYRGFIKIYAKYLELDETQVLQEYGMLESAAPKPSAAAKDVKNEASPAVSKSVVKEVVRPILSSALTNQRFNFLFKIIVVVVVGFFILKLVGNYLKKVDAGKKQESSIKVVKKPVIKPIVKTTSKSKTKEVKEQAGKDSSQEPVQKTSSAERNESAAVKAVDEKSSNAADDKSDKKPKLIELTVRATKNGWLQVKADGQVIFQSALKKGDSESWKADNEIELSGRNINLLEFELNGKMLGALGASDRGAKKVVFTKDGLSVKK